MPALVKALNKVDLPTFGRPTIPHFKLMSVPVSEARKCMSWATVRLLAGVLALFLAAQAAAATAPVTVLRDDLGTFEAHPVARSWVDAQGNATLPQVLALQ